MPEKQRDENRGALESTLSPRQLASLQWLGEGDAAVLGLSAQQRRNENTIRRWNEEVWSQGNFDLAYELIDDQFLVHGAGGQTVAQGPAGLIAFIEVWRKAFPDGRMEVDLLVSEGDLVGIRNTWHGTHLGDFYGIKPSGKKISVSSIGIDRVRDGKIVEGWGELNMLRMMQDLGGLPPLGQSAPAEGSRALVRRYLDEVWNQNKLEVVEELFAADYVIHSGGQDMPTSYEALEQGVAMAHETFPDIHMTLEKLVADGDKVTAYWTTRGTHLGEFRLPDMPQGIPPTGNAVEFTEAVTFRVTGGRLAEAWYAADRLTMLGQLGLGGSGPAGGPPPPAPVPKEVRHKASFRRFAEEAWNKGNLDVVDQVFAPEYIAHAANAEHNVYGPEGHKEFIASFRQAFPDVHLTFGDLLAEGDLLVARMTWAGTHMDTYMGIPATGKRVSVDVTGINRFENGLVVEAWGVVDMMGMLQQLGAIPAPGAEVAPPPAHDPLREANKAVAYRLIDEFWNQRDMSVADELVASEAISPSAPFLPPGPAGVRQIANMVFSGFPDFRMVIDMIMADEEFVVVHFVETGTHLGEFMGLPPTGRRATWNEMGLIQIRDGKIVRSWFETDMMSMMQQLGVVPALG